MDSVGLTSRWMAASRARESERPDALFDDPFAARLAGEPGVTWLSHVEASSGPLAFPPIRTRFFDDLIAAEPTAQVVLLGAGMDARAQRLSWAPGVVLYEVDQPAVLDLKARVLAETPARCERRVVACDLREAWEPALLAAGFAPQRPSLWVLEGLLMYLDAESVSALLGAVARLAAPGSRIGFDVPNPMLLAAPRMRGMLDALEAMGAPWRYGCADPEALLAEHGFHAVVRQPGQPGCDFGRWPAPIPPPGQPAGRFFLVTGTR
jgi:methyltransferase (TIGR00027 family)